MRLPFLQDLSSVRTKLIDTFGGINIQNTAGESEFDELVNMSSEEFPGICVRKKWKRAIKTNHQAMEHLSGFTTYAGFVIHAHAWTLLIGDGGNTTGPLSQGSDLRRRFAAMNEKLYVLPDKDIFTIKRRDDDGAAEIARELWASGDSSTIPELESFLAINNRMWGYIDNTIYASKLGDPTRWGTYEGISTDSFTAKTGIKGMFTGCIAYMGQPLFFAEHQIVKVYGDKPSNFQAVIYDMAGVAEKCGDTIQVINGVIYYLGYRGVYAYDGSYPSLISEGLIRRDEVETKLSGSAIRPSSGVYMDKYYLAFAGTLYVYDTKIRSWYKEEPGDIAFMAHTDNALYFVRKDFYLPNSTVTEASNNIYAKGNTEKSGAEFVEIQDPIPSTLVSKLLDEHTVNKKYISSIILDIEVAPYSFVDIYISYLNKPQSFEWEKVATITGNTGRIQRIPIIPKRHERFRYKIVGRGHYVLRKVAKYIEEGSEIGGNLHKYRN